MAISKILHMKQSGRSFQGLHLKNALEYVMNPEKTQDGKLVGGVNCMPEYAYEQMRKTKCRFGKEDKRQGYHLILSFPEGEISPERAYEFSERFVKEYLGEKYEAVFAIHDNTQHVHTHIIFNSVNFLDGRKYRYQKGDWAKEIQLFTNKLCREFGLSELQFEKEKEGKQKAPEWSEKADGKFIWSAMIARDIDACILQAKDYEEFLELLQQKGYEIKQGKHLALRPQGMQRFRRCTTLGEAYTKERILQRIETEDLAFYRKQGKPAGPRMVHCKVKHYRKAKLSGLQRKYYMKLYRVKRLKKKPYSQVWKYREDIRRMKQLQEQYLFLSDHRIQTVEDLLSVVEQLGEKKKEAQREKSAVYRKRQKCKELFDTSDEMKELHPAEMAYQQGDEFFREEHEKWEELEKALREQGYTYEEVQDLRIYYTKQIQECTKKEKAVSAAKRMGEQILKEVLLAEETKREKQEEKQKENTMERGEDGTKQKTNQSGGNRGSH